MERIRIIYLRCTICGSRTPIARKTKRHAERIDLTNRKLQKRVRLLHIFGARQELSIRTKERNLMLVLGT